MWGAFLYGGCLVIVPYIVSRSPDQFHEFLIKNEITVLNQTPSAFYQLITYESELDKAPSLKLRYVILGGEPTRRVMRAVVQETRQW